MFAAKKSPYMTWAKYHAGARYNLANSGILGCQNSDLELTMADILVNGPNHEGYAPLKEAIASKYGVKPEQVVPSQGTSMANFLAMATLVERGDEVLIEQPAYDPFIAAAAYLGAEVKRFSRTFENGFQIDPEEIRGKLTDRTRLIVISDPHNVSLPPAIEVAMAKGGGLAVGAMQGSWLKAPGQTFALIATLRQHSLCRLAANQRTQHHTGGKIHINRHRIAYRRKHRDIRPQYRHYLRRKALDAVQVIDIGQCLVRRPIRLRQAEIIVILGTAILTLALPRINPRQQIRHQLRWQLQLTKQIAAGLNPGFIRLPTAVDQIVEIKTPLQIAHQATGRALLYRDVADRHSPGLARVIIFIAIAPAIVVEFGTHQA